jgi:hypothetical protein
MGTVAVQRSGTGFTAMTDGSAAAAARQLAVGDILEASFFALYTVISIEPTPFRYGTPRQRDETKYVTVTLRRQAGDD